MNTDKNQTQDTAGGRLHPITRKTARLCYMSLGAERKIRGDTDFLSATVTNSLDGLAIYCWTRSSIWVPLSSFTFWVVELMTEPWALPAVAELRVSPCSPATPWLVELSAPRPATPPTPFTVLPAAPVADPATEPAVLPTEPTGRPALLSTPPPVLAERPPPAGLRPASPLSLASPLPAIFAGGARAWTTAPRDTSCPPCRTARSKAIPSRDSDSPLPRAWASVTCPTSFDPLCSTTLPLDFTSSVSLAVTSSPALAFLASRDFVSSA